MAGTSTLATTTINGPLTFTTASGTSITSTNAFFSNLVFGTATGTSLTSTNLAVTGALSLPANSITDPMVVPGLTISGGTIDNSPIGNTTPSTGIFTNVTTTNLFATNTVFINATSTNLFATGLTFTNASGTTLTSTNGIFTNLTFTNATGTVLYLSSALNINNAFTVNASGNVSVSGTLRIFDDTNFGDTLDDVVTRQYTAVNQTSTILDYLSDPETLKRGTGVATTLAVYSDDLTRILLQNTAVGASGVVSLKIRSLVPANTNQDAFYDNAGNLQTITASTLSGGGGAAAVRGVITYQGYHYLILANSGAITVKRATSTWSTNLSAAASWVTSTISGFTFTGTELGIVGAANGSIYIASSTTNIMPLAITTSTNTLTGGTPITLTGMTNSLNCTRVNENGIYTCAGSAPFIRKFNFSGVQQNPYGSGRAGAVPLTTGPAVFVSQYSYYAINGAATALQKQPF